jgi:hypothetical protein
VKPMTGMRGKVALAEMRRRKQEAEFQSFVREQQAKALTERINAGEQIDPSVLLEMSVKSAATLMGHEPPPDDPAGRARQELMQASYEAHVGVFVERLSRGFTIWDFADIVDGATRIEYDCDDRGVKGILVSKYQDEIQISGPALIPFLRYLHYLGIFQVEAARTPCPDCSTKEPMNCETCGGLGWLMPQPDSALVAE